MSELKVTESFQWFRDDFKTTSTIGKKTRIKGRAIFPTVSGNKRRYLESELIRAGRTLAGCPIDVNHEYDLWLSAKVAHEKLGKEFDVKQPKFKGNVLDADYEDGYVKYVAEINDPVYAEKLRDREKLGKQEYTKKWGIEPIRGVSISADYRYAEEKDSNGQMIPRGLFFRRLSLVEPPEAPGVKGTTIVLMESVHERSYEEAKAVSLVIQGVAPNLYETYKRNVMEPMKREVDKVAIRPDNPQDTVIFDSPPNRVEETALPEQTKVEEPKREDKRIGEPFSDYSSFEDCVAKNQDKGDPEAYCAEIKRKTEGETKVDENALDTVLDKVDAKAKELESVKEQELKKVKEDAVLEALRCASNKIKQLSERDNELGKALEEKTSGIEEVLTKKLSESSDAIKGNIVEEVGKLSEKNRVVEVTLTEKLECISKQLKGEVDTKASVEEVKAVKESLLPVGASLEDAAKLLVEQRDKLKGIEERFTKSFEEFGKKIAETETRIDAKAKEVSDASSKLVEELKTKLTETEAKSTEQIKSLTETNTKLREEAEKVKTETDVKIKETETKSLTQAKELIDAQNKQLEEMKQKLVEAETKLRESNEKYSKQLEDLGKQLETVKEDGIKGVKAITESVRALRTYIKPEFKSPEKTLETTPQKKEHYPTPQLPP